MGPFWPFWLKISKQDFFKKNQFVQFQDFIAVTSSKKLKYFHENIFLKTWKNSSWSYFRRSWPRNPWTIFFEKNATQSFIELNDTLTFCKKMENSYKLFSRKPLDKRKNMQKVILLELHFMGWTNIYKITQSNIKKINKYTSTLPLTV